MQPLTGHFHDVKKMPRDQNENVKKEFILIVYNFAQEKINICCFTIIKSS
jgi:hypothetical protein